MPYDPYPPRYRGAVPSRFVSFRYTMETGTFVPSPAVAWTRSLVYRSGSYPPSTSCRLSSVAVRADMS